jgi:hypothetical protein
MKLPKYPLASNSKLSTFEFISEGDKGLIIKLIQFQKTNLADVYNLAFGDKDPDSGAIDDKVVSNNGDGEKVLATVVSSVYAFTDRYPKRWIYATGSTKSRTRLYRMGISKYIEEIKRDFDILGEINGEWEEFKAGIDYDGFLAKRKGKLKPNNSD